MSITSLLRQTLRVGVGVGEAFALAKASACAEALPWHYGAATPTITMSFILRSQYKGRQIVTSANFTQAIAALVNFGKFLRQWTTLGYC